MFVVISRTVASGKKFKNMLRHKFVEKYSNLRLAIKLSIKNYFQHFKVLNPHEHVAAVRII